jgi:hypothetical protein
MKRLSDYKSNYNQIRLEEYKLIFSDKPIIDYKYQIILLDQNEH